MQARRANDGQRFAIPASPCASTLLLETDLDAFQDTALGCLAMAWLIRKSAALIAAYSIALQALLLGFAPAHHFSFDSFAIICSADSSGDHQPTPARHRSDCDACLAACTSSPALIPASTTFALPFLGDGPKRPTFLAEALSLQPRHQPHESRAPPMRS
jgi:hypothetical protein